MCVRIQKCIYAKKRWLLKTDLKKFSTQLVRKVSSAFNHWAFSIFGDSLRESNVHAGLVYQNG